MLLATSLFVAFTVGANAQDNNTNKSNELIQTENSLKQLSQEQEELKSSITIEELRLKNELDEAKKIEQEQKIAEQKRKEELKQQKQKEKEQKRELKKQKELIKSQNNLSKTTDKLHKAEDKFQKEEAKFIEKQSLGKLTPIEELKGKAKLLKLQTNIKELEFEVKKYKMRFEALQK